MKYLKLADVNNYLTDLDLPTVTTGMMAEFGCEPIDLEGVEFTTPSDFVSYYPEAIAMNHLLSKVVALLILT